MFNSKEFLKTVPESSGCYIMKDKKGVIIYIGKAKDLKARLTSYFSQSGDSRPFVSLLPNILSDIELILTPTEEDALILESTLIPFHKPKYNILLKYKSKELYLTLNEEHSYPALELSETPSKNGLGPFFSFKKAINIAQMLHHSFLLRGCNTTKFKQTKQPCIEFQIKRCSAPCANKISENDYLEQVEYLKEFLKGNPEKLIKTVEIEMYKASDELLFEKAIKLRDQIKQLRYFSGKKNSFTTYPRDIDIVSYSLKNGHLVIVVLIVRNKMLIDQHTLLFDNQDSFNEESMSSFLIQYYSTRTNRPKEVALPFEKLNFKNLENYFLTQKQSEIDFFHIEKNSNLNSEEKENLLNLIDIAQKNSENRVDKELFIKDKNSSLLTEIKEKLSLSNQPDIIECFDNSNLAGTHPVSSKVEFRNGIPYKKGYRHYNIKSAKGNDDFGMMREVLLRRLKKGISENQLPNLIVIDGGKGQLSSAFSILKQLSLEDKIDIISIAKIRSNNKNDKNSVERVFKPEEKEGIPLPLQSAETKLFTHLRDEAHRFAIEFHKKQRMSSMIYSELDSISGIGKKRKEMLLEKFKSVENIKNATLIELQEVLPDKTALQVFDYFKKDSE
ncbi:excinuclease ABC subunit UvrC [bacterium]|nr:excinuclease ABC subunit UvrC [bacterium]